jgi:hypothetical protein
MRWVKDQTGRFANRPHYQRAELDDECERLINGFLKTRYVTVTYPIKTDDLTVLVESLTEDLDLFSDLAGEEGEVEGITDFRPGRRPKVRISKLLTQDARMVNRLRTTLTHELGHIHLHTFLFNDEPSGDLFGPDTAAKSNKCKRATMLQAAQTDWMEWQAGYACGAFLMPATALRATIHSFLEQRRLAVARFGSNSPDGRALIQTVAQAYEVSQDAARVRLLQRGNLDAADIGVGLF